MSQSIPQAVSSAIDSTIRFFALYVTTLFSLDAYSAAANSPFGILERPASRLIHDSARRPQHRGYGEGPGRSFRIDPGGADRRDGGFRGATTNVDLGMSKQCRACGPTIH